MPHKYLKLAELLQEENCSVVACNIIIDECNLDGYKYGLEHIERPDPEYAQDVAIESVEAVLKAVGKGVARGLSAATTFLGNSVKRIFVATKHAEATAGRVNAKVENIGENKKTRFIDVQFIPAFWPNSDVTDFKYLASVVADTMSVTEKLPDFAAKLSKLVLSLRGVKSLDKLDTAMETLVEIVSDLTKSSKREQDLLSILQKARYANGFTVRSRKFKLYNKSVMFLIPRRYEKGVNKPLGEYAHISATEKGKTLSLPASSEMKGIVAGNNQMLAKLLKGSEVSKGYNNFAKDMRTTYASLSHEPDDKEVTTLASDCISGIYDIYKTMCFSYLKDSVQAIELYSVIIETAIDQYH